MKDAQVGDDELRYEKRGNEVDERPQKLRSRIKSTIGA